MRRTGILFLMILLLVSGCSNDKDDADLQEENETEITNREEDMKLFIQDREVPVSWEDNDSTRQLKELVGENGLSVEMSMYGGFEQVGPLGQKLTGNDQQISTDFGDIVLYASSQIVIFYGSNSWAYTRLGHIDLSQEELSQLLGNGDVVITIR